MVESRLIDSKGAKVFEPIAACLGEITVEGLETNWNRFQWSWEVCSKVDREFVGERNWEFSMSSLRCADSRNQKGQLSVTKLIPLKQRRQGPVADWWTKPRWDKVSPNRACS